jgi:dTDP-4-dehydrorhamnose 3,5-epimerase
MQFYETKLKGAFIIEPEIIQDDRGFFARSWCKKEVDNYGINSDLVQCNISFNNKKGTLRGMHYQTFPHGEAKLIRCTAGSIYDVIIDLRPDSETYKQWFGTELSQENHKMIFVPEDCAHGFLTLRDNTEVFYQMSEFYHAEYAIGVRWDDPVFSIDWPDEVQVISDRDRDYPDFNVRNRQGK